MCRVQVLDMEPLPKLKHAAGGWKFPRKRRRSNTDPEADQPNGTDIFIIYTYFQLRNKPNIHVKLLLIYYT